MKAKFHVKKFGPIKEANLDLRNVNVFIGPQASGKSVLAKLYSICKSPLRFLNEDYLDYASLINFKEMDSDDFEIEKFNSALADLNINNFLSSKSYVEYESEIIYFKYSNKKITFRRKFKSDISLLKELINSENKKEANQLVKKYFKKLDYFKLLSVFEIFESRTGKKLEDNLAEFREYAENFDFSKEKFSLGELQEIFNCLVIAEKKYLGSKVKYIPSERIIISILRKASWNLQRHDIPIPRHILNFAAEYEVASNKLKELDLSFIDEDLKYKMINGKERIYLSQRKSINLSESSTGIQSLVPLLLPILNLERNRLGKSSSYVIEEPEINLYPKAQYELIKFLESIRNDGFDDSLDSPYIHTYTTHSPYILASFNNMLFAYKKSVELASDSEKLKKLEKILPSNTWLNPNNFNAYTIKKGKAFRIFNRKIGLIDENIIDDVTDYMNDDFDRIMYL